MLKRVDGEGTTSVRVFESDDHLFKVGRGDVDDVEVMVAGNITNFPKRETQSDTMVCNQATSTPTPSSSRRIIIPSPILSS